MQVTDIVYEQISLLLSNWLIIISGTDKSCLSSESNYSPPWHITFEVRTGNIRYVKQLQDFYIIWSELCVDTTGKKHALKTCRYF